MLVSRPPQLEDTARQSARLLDNWGGGGGESEGLIGVPPLSEMQMPTITLAT